MTTLISNINQTQPSLKIGTPATAMLLPVTICLLLGLTAWTVHSLGVSSAPGLRSVDLTALNSQPYSLLVSVDPGDAGAPNRARIKELEKLKRDCPDLAVSVLFLKAKDDTREKEALWQSAATIPGIRLVSDQDSTESNNFQTLKSGQAALYDPKGKLCFAGNMTELSLISGDLCK